MLSAKLIPVASKCFDASGYFGGRAAFRYHNGRVVYRDIPVTLWQRFMEAPSKGKFFKENIKFVRRGRECCGAISTRGNSRPLNQVHVPDCSRLPARSQYVNPERGQPE